MITERQTYKHQYSGEVVTVLFEAISEITDQRLVVFLRASSTLVRVAPKSDFERLFREISFEEKT